MTPKQEAFCRAYLEKGNATEAYRLAYNAENMAQTTVTPKASKLLSQDNIRARLQELRGALVKASLWSRQQSVITLAGIASSQESKASDKIAAVKELNVLHGYNVPVKNNPFVGPDGEPLKVVISTCYVSLNRDASQK